ncbi:hypothetical protein [Lentzea sp. NPDC055074]
MAKTRCSTERAEVTLRSKTMLLEFTGECDGDPLTWVRLSAELPDAGGPEDGGTIVLEQDGAVVTQPDGEVRLTAQEPVRWGQGPVDADFVLPESPEATVLAVRGLVVEVG